jgi:hypothetical protein
MQVSLREAPGTAAGVTAPSSDIGVVMILLVQMLLIPAYYFVDFTFLVQTKDAEPRSTSVTAEVDTHLFRLDQDTL